jgi:hypothetical protein
MSNAAFPWTFDVVFEPRRAPPADETSVNQLGDIATTTLQEGTVTTGVEPI